MIWEEIDSNTRRTITDLSWPKGQSVNVSGLYDYYLGTASQLHYPSAEYLFNRLNSLGPAASIFNLSKKLISAEPCKD